MITPMFTMGFKESTDRGFDIRTPNIKFVIRMPEREYYSFIDTLVNEVIDEVQERGDYDSYSIEGLQNYLSDKINGNI